MAVIGGDILEISFNHPTLGSGSLFPKSNEQSTLDTGGFRTEDDANHVDGGGRNIRKMNRVRWYTEQIIANDINVAQELEKVVAMAGDPLDGEWTLTHISGAVYKGTGSPVGEHQLDLNAATFSLKIGGGGKMKKIA